ncbi:MAG: hypothetical protein JWQ27_1756 [Ferruginibacter sp.]|nr:hypothetical protein [Ferruginibacter sp.]
MTEPILYHLYNEMREDKQWISPGLDEYYLLFDLFETGYPVKTFDDFAFIIETIWLKSHHQKQKLRDLLELRRKMILQFVASLATDGPAQKTQVDEQVKEPATTTDPKLPDVVLKPADENNAKPVTDKLPDISLEEDTAYGNTRFSISQHNSSKASVLKFETAKETILPLQQIPYLFTNDYFPIQSRHMQQAWRTLKNKQEGEDGPDLDIDKTIDHTAKQGYFSSLEYEKRILNQLQLFIFLDQSESMIAVEEFGKELCSSAFASDLHAHAIPWYFYQLPQKNENGDYLFTNEDWTESASLRTLLFNLNKKNIVILIYSDAGALRNCNETARLKETIDFIKVLNKRTAYIAWLNPAPKNRWKGNNAERISAELPMFETERRDLENAVAALKGKLAY